MAEKEKRVVFFHPDLGIGGAERLVIDAAVGLQSLGHKVTIFTSYCDAKHCFDEARDAETTFGPKGTLDVRVRGGDIVPPALFGRFAVLCAILRQLHLVLAVTVFSSELKNLEPTHFFVDQLSACVPLLRLLCDARVLFYCHFPDKLLVQRSTGVFGALKRVYRRPFDAIEGWSTGCSDGIVVNSKFTRRTVAKTFPALEKRQLKVVYPCVDTAAGLESDEKISKPLWPGKKVLLSINRFERKKDVGLALRAFAGLSEEERRGARLVVAGGYDPRVTENVSYHKQLEALAESLKLVHRTARTLPSALAISDTVSVLFLLSVPNALKQALLKDATLLVYTPKNEHFGIVPLEAMLTGKPVLAADQGGPTETVVDGETGWLRDPDAPDEWTGVMRNVLTAEVSVLREMGARGRERVMKEFSKERMAKRLDLELAGLSAAERPVVVQQWVVVAVVLATAASVLGSLVVLLTMFLTARLNPGAWNDTVDRWGEYGEL
ncbi:Alpha-1,3-mannosyltransferase-like protein [Elasticomyces elasticus]|nr:Alpha-1,3-mannosyltransferase-like protein [Elasticomyces elasticus]